MCNGDVRKIQTAGADREGKGKPGPWPKYESEFSKNVQIFKTKLNGPEMVPFYI